MWMLAAFLAVPVIEIALFIEVGGLIGLWPTLGLVILSAFVGLALIRRQGVATLGRLRARVEAGGDPSGPIADGALVAIGGVLLMIPGFLTDVLGLALLVPAVRAVLLRRAAGRMRGAFVFSRAGAGPATRRTARADAIEAEYEVLDDVPPAQRGASGWTRPQS